MLEDDLITPHMKPISDHEIENEDMFFSQNHKLRPKKELKEIQTQLRKKQLENPNQTGLTK